MTDDEITREMTFSEELPYFKERMKEISDNYDNPDGYADVLYLSALSDSNRIVRKAEEEIKRQKAEIERLKKEVSVARDAYISIQDRYEHTKTEAYKEFAKRLKNKIKTECNPYGKPTYDYDTSISIMNYMDNLLKEMVGERKMTDLQDWLFADINEIIDCWSEKEGNDIE